MKRIVQIDIASKTITGGPWVYPDEFAPSGDLALESWALTNGYKYTPPAPAPVPDAVPAWALLAVIDEMGKLQQLNSAIARYSGPDASKVRHQFARGDTFPRRSAAVDWLAEALELTESATDDAFRRASLL